MRKLYEIFCIFLLSKRNSFGGNYLWKYDMCLAALSHKELHIIKYTQEKFYQETKVLNMSKCDLKSGTLIPSRHIVIYLALAILPDAAMGLRKPIQKF